MITKNEKFPFLNERLAREAHIEEILSEIEISQRNWLKKHSGELSTIENLNDSRNIKLPITQKRLMNIQYLVDLLMKDHPAEIKPVYSFKFIINPENKNLSIEEKMEITLMMRETDYNMLISDRDEQSVKNLIGLLESFRLFNLTKLIKKSKNRNNLTQIVKSQLGTTIFTFKNFSLDKSGMEIVEDYCFHKSNYDSVKMKIDIDVIKKIIEKDEPAIDRRLKNFGILNSTISDYRDNKLDYILNILLGDLAPSLDKNNIVAIKNFKHLRDCLIKVEKLMDPVIILDAEIMKHLQQNFISTEKDILSLFADMTSETIIRWELEKDASGKVIIHMYNNTKYLIDPSQFLIKYETYTQSIIQNENGSQTGESQHDSKIFTADLLTDTANRLLEKEQTVIRFFPNPEDVIKLKQLIDGYQGYKKSLITMRNIVRVDSDDKIGSSFLTKIANSIMMLFTKKEKSYALNPQKKESVKVKSVKTEISNETKDIYKEISLKNSPIIPISDFIEIKPENENKIEKLISEIRENNLKIVIPIYNARQTLYIQRSKKYLLSDVEYLMLDPKIASTPESIRDYVDSIAGYKLKEDVIAGSALFSIEKYLMSIYRQNRAKLKKTSEKK